MVCQYNKHLLLLLILFYFQHFKGIWWFHKSIRMKQLCFVILLNSIWSLSPIDCFITEYFKRWKKIGRLTYFILTTELLLLSSFDKIVLMFIAEMVINYYPTSVCLMLTENPSRPIFTICWTGAVITRWRDAGGWGPEVSRNDPLLMIILILTIWDSSWQIIPNTCQSQS